MYVFKAPTWLRRKKALNHAFGHSQYAKSLLPNRGNLTRKKEREIDEKIRSSVFSTTSKNERKCRFSWWAVLMLCRNARTRSLAVSSASCVQKRRSQVRFTETRWRPCPLRVLWRCSRLKIYLSLSTIITGLESRTASRSLKRKIDAYSRMLYLAPFDKISKGLPGVIISPVERDVRMQMMTTVCNNTYICACAYVPWEMMAWDTYIL